MSIAVKVTETIQIGVEAPESPGVAVPATVKIGSVKLEPQTNIDIEMYGPDGIKDDTIAIFNRERSSAALSGKPVYNEAPYFASSCLCAPDIDAIQYQSVAVTGASGGTLTLTFDSQETGAIDFDATAAEVETALLALSNIDPGDIACTGGPLNTAPVIVKFKGQFLNVDEATLIPDDTNLTGGGAEEATVTPGESTAAFAWDWSPDSDALDDPATLTVESVGDADKFRFVYGLVNQLGITNVRAPGGNSIDMSGQMVGKPIDFGIDDETAGLSFLDLVPLTPLQFSLYLDTTAAADFGTTQYTDSFRTVWNYGPKYQLKESQDASEASFTAHYEPGKTPSTVEIQLERNATAVALFNTLRAGGTVYLRWEAVGPEIETGVNYLFRLDFAGKLANPNMSAQDGLSTITFTVNKALDATWGQALRLQMVTDVPFLIAP